jgi:hypothetical protein
MAFRHPDAKIDSLLDLQLHRPHGRPEKTLTKLNSLINSPKWWPRSSMPLRSQLENNMAPNPTGELDPLMTDMSATMLGVNSFTSDDVSITQMIRIWMVQ